MIDLSSKPDANRDNSPLQIQRDQNIKNSALESSVKYEPTPQSVYRWSQNKKQTAPGMAIQNIQKQGKDNEDSRLQNEEFLQGKSLWKPGNNAYQQFGQGPQVLFTQPIHHTNEVVPVTSSMSGHTFNERKIELAPHGMENCDGDSDDMINVEEDSPERPSDQNNIFIKQTIEDDVDFGEDDNQPLFSTQFYPNEIPQSKRSISFNPSKTPEPCGQIVQSQYKRKPSMNQEEPSITPEPIQSRPQTQVHPHQQTLSTHGDIPNNQHSRLRVESANFSDICNYESGNDRYSIFAQKFSKQHPSGVPIGQYAQNTQNLHQYPPTIESQQSYATSIRPSQIDERQRNLDDTNARTLGKYDQRKLSQVAATTTTFNDRSETQMSNQIPNFQVEDIVTPQQYYQDETSPQQNMTQPLNQRKRSANEIENIISRESAYAHIPAFKKETQGEMRDKNLKSPHLKQVENRPRQIKKDRTPTRVDKTQEKRKASKSPVPDVKKMRGRIQESESAKKRQVSSQLEYSRSKTKTARTDQEEELIKLEEEYYRLMHLQKQAHLKEMRKTARDKQQAQTLKATKVIQKYTRGFLARLRFRKMQQVYLMQNFRENFKFIRKLRRFLSVGFKQIKHRLLLRLKQTMKDCSEHQAKVQEQLYSQFRNHCATLIQKHYRGFSVRMYELPQIQKQNKVYQKIRGFVKAWKVRHIMQTRDVFQIRASIKDIDKMIEEYLFMNTQKDKSINFSQNVQMIDQLTKNRKKQVEMLIRTITQLYKNGNWFSRYLKNVPQNVPRGKTEKYQKEGIFIQNKQQQRPGNDRYHQPLQQMSIATPLVKQQSFDAPRPYFDQSCVDGFAQSQMQSSQMNQKQPPPAFEMYKTADHFNKPGGAYHHQNYSAGQMDNIQQKQFDQNRYGDINQMISPRRYPQPQFDNIPEQPMKQIDQTPQQLEEDDDEDIDAYLERMQRLKDAEMQQKPQEEEFYSQGFDSNKAPQQNHYEDEIQVFSAETPMETPLKPKQESVPTQIPAQTQNKFNEDAPAVAKGAYSLDPVVEDASEAPKYNFEEMLKKAMEQEGAAFEEAPVVESEPANPPKKKFVSKKKKYDPRKAIEEEKKRRKQKKEHVSAFPKGFFKKEDEEEEKNEVREQRLESEENFYKNSESDKSRKQSKDFNNEQQEDDEQTEQEMSKERKTFLKRKSRAPQFQKLNWNRVGSRIDCWSAAKNAQKNMQASAPASVQPQKKKHAPTTPKKTVAKKDEKGEKGGQKKRPPVIQKQQQRMVVEGHEDDDFQLLDSVAAANQPPTSAPIGPGLSSSHQVPQFYIKDEDEIETIPDEKDHIDRFLNSGPTQVLDFDDTSFQSQQNQPPMILQMEELLKIYDVFHPKGTNLVEDGFIKDKQSLIPKMNSHSLFFQCYSDEIYEVSFLVYQ